MTQAETWIPSCSVEEGKSQAHIRRHIIFRCISARDLDTIRQSTRIEVGVRSLVSSFVRCLRDTCNRYSTEGNSKSGKINHLQCGSSIYRLPKNTRTRRTLSMEKNDTASRNYFIPRSNVQLPSRTYMA